MKVLIITNHFLERNEGGCLASRAFINAFSTLFTDCTLIYPESEIDIRPFVSSQLKLVSCKDRRPLLMKGVGVYFGKLHRFHNTVKKYLRKNAVDLIVFDTSIVSQGLHSFAKKRDLQIITINHNVEAEYLKDNKPPPLIRIPFLYFMKKTERRAVQCSDLGLTLTKFDESKLKTIYAYDNKINLNNLGIFEAPNANIICIGNDNITKSAMNRFVITGSLSYSQSEISIIEFINKYFPILQNTINKCELIIAGRNPSERLKTICNHHNQIRLISNPDNMSEIIFWGDIYLCPISMGGGFKLRIMDALKFGLPILTHEISSRGYESFVQAKMMYVYNSKETFAEALIQMKSKIFIKGDITKLYEKEFSFLNGVNKLDSILKSGLPGRICNQLNI